MISYRFYKNWNQVTSNFQNTFATFCRCILINHLCRSFYKHNHMDIVETTTKLSQEAQTINFAAKTFSFQNISLSHKIGDVKTHKSFRNSSRISGKWQKRQVNRWLCFLVRYSLHHPNDDVLTQMILSNFEEKIYQQMEKYLQPRNAYECQFFTKSILRQNMKRGQTKIVFWATANLKKCKEPWIKRLVAESELKLSSTISYMAFIEQFNSELKNYKEEKMT